jgi:hypothetical protein
MVLILAASSLHHALETLTLDKKEPIESKLFSIPGLSLNKNTKNPKKIVQNLLVNDLKDKENIFIWHDVLNNSISRHESNNFRSLTVPELIEVLKSLQDKLSALVYCHRYRTPDIFEQLKTLESDLNIKVFNIVKDFISPKKQKDPALLKNFKALHQSPELELKNLDFLLRKENELSSITAKSRPKRPSKRARKAIRRAAPSS